MLHLSETRLQDDFRGRFFVVGVIISSIFFLLIGRVWFLQVFHGRKFREFADQNRITIKTIPAVRGRILDRNGIVIADTRPSFDLTITPFRVAQTSIPLAIDHLAQTLGWKDVDYASLLTKIETNGIYDPTVIRRDMSRDELSRFLARRYAFPGFEVIHSPARSYPYGTHGSHLLGYLSEINKVDLGKMKESEENPYRLGDVWGIAGVEKKYDTELRGEDGSRPFVSDASGRELREELSDELLPAFQYKSEIPGLDLVLTIDARVQEAAENAFEKTAGAVVAIDPNNGDILALVSRPEYAPENFARGVSTKYWQELTQDTQNPLYDRALRGLYPPGSTFKMVTAWAALEEKVTTPDETVFCGGSYRLGRETKSCWKKQGHGFVNLHRAIVESCDVYFYEIGRRLGIERIAKYAKVLGLGSATGMELNREEKGLVPTEEWKKRVYNQPWVGGETLSVAIGQGALQITPIQLAFALATMANGGTLYQPRIALEGRDIDGKSVKPIPVTTRAHVTMDANARKLVLSGLDGVVNEEGGTAYWVSRSSLVRIGGKTGTAQVVGKRAAISVEDHAWFIAFAPVENPKIAVAVIVEHGGHGGVTAAPIAKKVIEAYLGGPS